MVMMNMMMNMMIMKMNMMMNMMIVPYNFQKSFPDAKFARDFGSPVGSPTHMDSDASLYTVFGQIAGQGV